MSDCAVPAGNQIRAYIPGLIAVPGFSISSWTEKVRLIESPAGTIRSIVAATGVSNTSILTVAGPPSARPTTCASGTAATIFDRDMSSIVNSGIPGAAMSPASIRLAVTNPAIGVVITA